MLDTLYDGIDQINAVKKPISKAWELATKYLGIENESKKITEILGDHENLFINKNPYHNHYHLAEVIFTSAVLLKAEVPQECLFNHAIMILFAATFHDVEHPGRTNKDPFEAEKVSATFFKQWWKNNSLFVENIVNMNPLDMEEAINELILFTEFNEGSKKVKEDYIKRKNKVAFSLEHFMSLKKVLTEADLLLNFLPLTAFKKCSLIIDEAKKDVSEKEKWMFILQMITTEAKKEFTSEAIDLLDIQHEIDKFRIYLEENQKLFGEGTLQGKIQRKFQITTEFMLE